MVTAYNGKHICSSLVPHVSCIASITAVHLGGGGGGGGVGVWGGGMRRRKINTTLTGRLVAHGSVVVGNQFPVRSLKLSNAEPG